MSALAKALLEFQKDAPALQRDSLNPHFRSKFLSLEKLMAAVVPVANKHGLVISQMPTAVDGFPALHTRIIHAESGEELADTMLLNAQKNDPQGQGSAITYARRYALMAALGLVADEDDDGNAATQNRGRASTAAARENAAGSDEAGSTDPAPDNPAAAAQAAAEAAKAARTPTDNGDPRNVILTFGKHKNANLGAVPSAYLEWLIGNFEAKTAEQRRILAAAQAVLAGDYPDEELPFA